MKKIVGKAVAVIVALVVILGVYPAMTVNASKKVVSYVALGDSLTDYATYSDKEWTSYPVYVAEMVNNDTGINLDIKNDAVGGFRADDVISQLESNDAVIADVKNADIITVMIGGNDLIAAMGQALASEGLDINSFISNDTVTTDSPSFKATYIALREKSNAYHQAYITGIDNKIKRIVELIRSYNPDCKVAISTIYYNENKGPEYISKMTGMSTWDAYLFSAAYESAIREMQGYFKAAANSDANITYVSVDSLADNAYIQLTSDGKYLDFHPNMAGQKELANCFYNDFWSEINLDSIAREESDAEPADQDIYFAIDGDGYSVSNAEAGESYKLTVDETGTGGKFVFTASSEARKFEYTVKPAKMTGVSTGISFMDDTNGSQISIRFKGTNTKSIYIYAGTEENNILRCYALGFDSSVNGCTFEVSFDNNSVTVLANGNQVAALNISKYETPSGAVHTEIYSRADSWAGTFPGRKAISAFSDVQEK